MTTPAQSAALALPMVLVVDDLYLDYHEAVRAAWDDAAKPRLPVDLQFKAGYFDAEELLTTPERVDLRVVLLAQPHVPC